MDRDFIEAMRPVFDRLPDGVCIADAEGHMIYANHALGRLLGPATAECESQSICTLLCGHLDCGNAKASECPLRTAEGPRNSMTFAGRYRPQHSAGWYKITTARPDIRVHCQRLYTSEGERHLIIAENLSGETERRSHPRALKSA